MNLNDDCLVNKGHEKDSIVVCKDAHGSSQSHYRLTNNTDSTIRKYQLDGCLIKSNNTEKCDFLLTVQGKSNHAAVFIELKGKEFSKAISQINTSIDQLRPDKDLYKVFARIVMSVAPKAQGPAYIKLSEKLAALNGSLEIRSRVFSEKTSELL